MIFTHNHRDYHHHQHSNEFQRLSHHRQEPLSPPSLPPKRNFYKMASDAQASTKSEVYLDQPTSSFV